MTISFTSSPGPELNFSKATTLGRLNTTLCRRNSQMSWPQNNRAVRPRKNSWWRRKKKLRLRMKNKKKYFGTSGSLLHILMCRKRKKIQKDHKIKSKDKQGIDMLSQKFTYNTLEERFREQLIQKEQDWEKTFKLMEDEKNSLVQKEQDWDKKLKLVENEKNRTWRGVRKRLREMRKQKSCKRRNRKRRRIRMDF